MPPPDRGHDPDRAVAGRAQAESGFHGGAAASLDQVAPLADVDEPRNAEASHR
jgi:hypothetical protein